MEINMLKKVVIVKSELGNSIVDKLEGIFGAFDTNFDSLEKDVEVKVNDEFMYNYFNQLCYILSKDKESLGIVVKNVKNIIYEGRKAYRLRIDCYEGI